MINLKIKETIEAKGLKIGDVAKKIGMSFPNFSRNINNRTKAVNLKMLDDLCRVLKVKPADLIERTPDTKD